MNNNIAIHIKYNSQGHFCNLDEVKTELSNHYLTQVRPKWLASASEGLEIWIDIVINSPIIQFISNAVAGGLVWDLIKVGKKSIKTKPLFENLEKLISTNEKNGIRVLALKFQFDDTIIKVYGLNGNFTSIMSSVFQKLSTEIPYLNQQGVTEINEIRLPIIEVEKPDGLQLQYDIFNESKDFNTFLKRWEVISRFGCLRYIYTLESRKVEELYEDIY